MGKKLDTTSIRAQIDKIKPFNFYLFIMMMFVFTGGMFFFYGFYNDSTHLYTAVAGIWIVAGIAIYTIGYLTNMYKKIIENLLFEVNNKNNITNAG